MMTNQRIVLDTNLIVSAALQGKSVSRQAFDLAIRQCEILVSVDTQNELSEVLMRPKFDRYISEEKRLRFLAGFLQLTRAISIDEKIQECRDPKDDKFLEVAVNGEADCIVSGDDDLKVMHPFRGIAILSPRKFLEQTS